MRSPLVNVPLSGLLLVVTAMAAPALGAEPPTSPGEERVTLKRTQPVTTREGLTLTFDGTGLESSQPGQDNPRISAPAMSLERYRLRAVFGADSRQFILSEGVGMVTHGTEHFAGFTITLVSFQKDVLTLSVRREKGP